MAVFIVFSMYNVSIHKMNKIFTVLFKFYLLVGSYIILQYCFN
jgi:hypothetical protein